MSPAYPSKQASSVAFRKLHQDNNLESTEFAKLPKRRPLKAPNKGFDSSDAVMATFARLRCLVRSVVRGLRQANWAL
jgi:hypothetical protein